MEREHAIQESKKGTAAMRGKEVDKDVTFIAYHDGGVYKLVATDRKVLFEECRMLLDSEIAKLDALNEWIPSELLEI